MDKEQGAYPKTHIMAKMDMVLKELTVQLNLDKKAKAGIRKPGKLDKTDTDNGISGPLGEVLCKI